MAGDDYLKPTPDERDALGLLIGMVWHCPGCGCLIPDALRVAGRADFPCRCGVYSVSDYLIWLPDVTMSDSDARDPFKQKR